MGLQIRIADIPHRFSEGIEDAAPARLPARRPMHVIANQLMALRSKIAGALLSGFTMTKAQPIGVPAQSRCETPGQR